MKFNIPNVGTLEHQYNSLCSWINSQHTEPFHKTSLMEHKRKYLGHYVTHLLESENDLSECFLVYDLYMYEGSKFTGRNFIAVFGDNQTDYISIKEALVMNQSNKELSCSPLGEAYRRFRKRKPVLGSLSKLR